jgi:hypothetical protein
MRVFACYVVSKLKRHRCPTFGALRLQTRRVQTGRYIFIYIDKLIQCLYINICLYLMPSTRLIFKSRGSAVGVTTKGWTSEVSGVRVLVGPRILSIMSRQVLWTTQPPKQWLRGILSPGGGGVRHPRLRNRGSIHSPP